MDKAQIQIAHESRELERVAHSNTARLRGAEQELRKAVWSYLSKRGSLRKVAKELGFSAPYLSDVSLGRRKVSRELVKRVLAL
jgi:hypothetical protein